MYSCYQLSLLIGWSFVKRGPDFKNPKNDAAITLKKEDATVKMKIIFKNRFPGKEVHTKIIFGFISIFDESF